MASVVTPSHSRSEEEAAGDHHCCWQAKLESGCFHEADWEMVASQARTTHIPWLEHAVSSLPRPPSSLHSTRRPTSMMVRTVAVVQDQLDLEFYRSTSSSTPQGLRDRQPLVLAPLSSSSLPCSPWFRNLVVGDASSRSHDDEGNNDYPDPHPENRPTKRLRRGGLLDNDEEEEEGRHRDDREEAPPLVVAKLYYDQYYAPKGCRRRLQLNEVVEAVGVLEWIGEEVGDGSALQAFRDHDEGDLLQQQPQWSYDSWDGVDHWVAPPQAPVLHVLWFQATDLDRLTAAATAVSALLSAPVPPSIPVPPSQLLARSLSVSDTVGAAIWMTLMSLAERQIVQVPIDDGGEDATSTLWVPVDTPQDTTLGCASLHLVTSNREACDQLYQRLKALLCGVVPLVQALSIQPGPDDTLPSLPAKKAGRLHPSPLQLPKGSTLILNVGACDPITVAALTASSTKGGGIWKALQDFTTAHKLQYTFEGISIAFEADLRIVVVSTPTTKQLLPCTLQCAASTTAGSASEAHRAEGALALRRALAQARAVATPAPRENDDRWASNIGFSKPVLDRAQQDFMQRRQRARQQPSVVLPNEADFHRWLTLTRLQARSRNASMAEVLDWEEALALDDAMVASMM